MYDVLSAVRQATDCRGCGAREAISTGGREAGALFLEACPNVCCQGFGRSLFLSGAEAEETCGSRGSNEAGYTTDSPASEVNGLLMT